MSDASSDILSLVRLVNSGSHELNLRKLCVYTLDEIYAVLNKHPSMAGNFYEIPLLLHYFFRLHSYAGVLVNLDRGGRKAPSKLMSLDDITGGGSAGGAVDITHVDFSDNVIGFTSKYKRKKTLALADLEFLAVKASIDAAFPDKKSRYYGISIRCRSQVQHLFKTGELTSEVVVYDFNDMRTFWNDIRSFLASTDKSLHDIERSINAHHKTNLILRKEQLAGVDAAVSYLSNHGDEFLLHAKMRYGKIVTAYEITKRMKAKTVLMATFFPAVNVSWQEDAFAFDTFSNIRVINANKCAVIDITPKSDDEITLVLTSYQDFKEMTSKARWQNVVTHEWDLLISDEFHYGVESPQTTALHAKTRYKKHLALSGTPLKALLRGRFSTSNTYTWTYIDEQKAKQSGLSAYKWLPTLNMHMMHIPISVQEDVGMYNDDEAFTLRKLFAVEYNKFIHEDTVIRFLDMLSGVKGFKKELSPWHFGTTGTDGLRHTVWYMPDVASTNTLSCLLATHSFFKKYKILAISSKKYNASDVLDVVRHHCDSADIDMCSGSITLAYKQLNTGSSVPKWSGVLMLNNTQSVETYLQTIFRAQTQNHRDLKTDCHVFDFNPSRCLQVLHEFASVSATDSSSQMLCEWLEFAPLLSHADNKIVSVDEQEFLRQFAITGNHSRVFGNDNSFDITQLSDELRNQIITVKPVRHTCSFDDISGNALPIGKSQHIERQGTSQSNDAQASEDRTRIKNIMRSLPWLLVFGGAKHDDVIAAITSLKPRVHDALTERVGVSVDTLLALMKSPTVCREYVNRQIRSFNLAYKTDKPNILKNMIVNSGDANMLRAQGEYPTPDSVIDEMLASLPIKLWSDATLKWLDPACSSGGFLVAIFDRLMIGLAVEITNAQKRANHILSSMLYGIDIKPSSIIVAKTRLKYGRNVAKNVVCLDALSVDHKTFDVIVCAPSSLRAAPKQFIKMSLACVADGGVIACTTPINALVPGMSSLIPMFQSAHLTHLNIDSRRGGYKKTIWFTLRKSSRQPSFCTSRFGGKRYHGLHQLDHSLEFIPALITNESLSIIRKLLSYKTTLSLVTTRQNKANATNKHLRCEQTPEFCYPYANTGAEQWAIKYWSDQPHAYQYDAKVLISEVGLPRMIFDDGVLGMTCHALAVLVRDGKEAKALMSILSSALYRFFLMICNVRHGEMQHLYFYQILPSLSLDLVWDDDMIFTFFDINDAEQRLIKRVVSGN